MQRTRAVVRGAQIGMEAVRRAACLRERGLEPFYLGRQPARLRLRRLELLGRVARGERRALERALRAGKRACLFAAAHRAARRCGPASHRLAARRGGHARALAR
jgi:hypothetical protein